MADQLNHLLVIGATEAISFKSTLQPRGQEAPQRDRNAHGTRLLQELAALSAQSQALQAKRVESGFDPHIGIAISLEISPPGALDASKFEWRRDGIEVLAVTPRGDQVEVVTLFVPEGRLQAFERRIKEYLEKDAKTKEGAPTKPANAALVNAIMSFRRAAFDNLWTDLTGQPPPEGQTWFQVWLRTGGAAPAQVYQTFSAAAAKLELELAPGYVTFPGRVVVAVRATRTQLENALDLLDVIAEIRLVHPTAQFFLSDLTLEEQARWITNLTHRLQAPPAGSDVPHVAVLDTGVNNGHPLLAPLLADADCHAASPAWPVTDGVGHGTEMAGLSALGDLIIPMSNNEPLTVPHRLESASIFPPHGANPPKLYGAVTAAGIAAVEQAAPARRRVFAMMTSEDGDTSGLPSEWSAALDRLTCGLPLDAEEVDDPGPHRLIVLAGGNMQPGQWGQPNDLHPIESPGQAWNVLTVGACTDKMDLDPVKYPSYQMIRAAGQQAACSRTSVLWSKSAWPFKPDVVAEGGNGCFDAATGNSPLVGPESLRLLTTGHDFLDHPLAESGDTSGAAAEVARICGHIAARYPQYWPETIRGLIVHGASITPAMRAGLPVNPNKSIKERLLRSVGFGRVDLDASLYSTTRRASLVLQESLTPYVKQDDGSSVKLGDMNLHALPWPAAQLQGLGNADVTLRVTLSYFVEPNPSRRGWQSKFRYQSHGLRFAVKGATESDDRFLQRVNKLERENAQDANTAESMSDPDADGWTWGAQLRSRGSIHHDEWTGTAADLATKSHVAVYPVGGWWKDWKDSKKHSTQVRYALIVTLAVAADVDIFTPIATQIGVAVPV